MPTVNPNQNIVYTPSLLEKYFRNFFRLYIVLKRAGKLCKELFSLRTYIMERRQFCKEKLMRICFVSEGEFGAYKTDCNQTTDLVVFDMGRGGEVSYERELKGESAFFEEIALLSKIGKNLLVCGCITDTRGHKRKSAVVAENGRILGVSDMLNVIDDEVGAGAGLRIYETKVGKMGVLVADDIRFFDAARALAACGSDFIVCPFGKVCDSLQSVLLRALAYENGLPIFFCGTGYSMIAGADGNIAFASPHSPVYTEFANVKEYHLIQTRKRGFYWGS
jgi:hypothetical protein